LEKDVEKKHKIIIREIDKKFKREEMEEKKNEKREKKEEKNLICPHCSTIITLECEPSQKIVIDCPICGKKGITTFKNEKETFEKLETEKTNIHKEKEKKHADKPETHPPKNPSFIRSNIINLILITVGIIFLYNPTITNIKISFTLILIGLILIFILPEESPSKILIMRTRKSSSDKVNHKSSTRSDLKSRKKIRLPISYTITLTLLIWIIFLFFITDDAELEVFFVLILIGMLVVRELTDELTTKRLKHRMDGFIYIFLITFIWIIGEKNGRQSYTPFCVVKS